MGQSLRHSSFIQKAHIVRLDEIHGLFITETGEQRDALKAPVKTGMGEEVRLRAKSSTEKGVAIRSDPELCLDNQ